MHFKIPSLLFFSIIIIEGAISIGIELLAIREISAYVGNSIINTSIIIGIFLLFLSFGYYAGGQKKDPSLNLLAKNLIIAAAFFIIGFSDPFLTTLFSVTGLISPPFLVLTFSLIILSPIIYHLGQTIPILTNFINSTSITKVSARVLFLSTIGSFIGSILTTTLLVNYLGASITIQIYTYIMLLMALSILIYTRTHSLSHYSPMTLIFILTLSLSSIPYYDYKNNYSNTRVTTTDNINYLTINNSNSSSYNPTTNNSTFKYAHRLQDILDVQYRTTQDILIIGAGGFTLSLKNKHHNYTYVDIDKDLKNLAQEKLIKQPITGTFIPQGIRNYLATNPTKTFDIIVLDAFSSVFSIPASLITTEFFSKISNQLNDNGIFFVNFITNPYIFKPYNTHFQQTINTNFNCFAEVIPRISPQISNILYICSKKDDIIYTDDKINLFELINLPHK